MVTNHLPNGMILQVWYHKNPWYHKTEKLDKTVDEIEVVTEVGFWGIFFDEFLLLFFLYPKDPGMS